MIRMHIMEMLRIILTPVFYEINLIERINKMERLEINEEFITTKEFRGNKEIKNLGLINAIVVSSSGAFADCESLENVYFGLDITRIGNGTFQNCKNLTDVYFAITDKDKIVEIAEDAFAGCPKQITFHIFASAIANKHLNQYARRHNFKVEGMI